MGHERVGALPKTKPWRKVVKDIASYNGDAEQSRRIANQTLENVRDRFESIQRDPNVLDRTRNRFSESHFDEEADRWLAVFARDPVNSEIRLLLHFMKERATGGADDLPDQT
jgi:hypothetical protein